MAANRNVLRRRVFLYLSGMAGAVLALFLFGCEEQVVDKPPPPPATGSIHVTSTPAGARVFFNDSDTGRVTPYTIPKVPAGFHTIRLTLARHSDWGPNTVSVTAGRTATVNATLIPENRRPTPPPVESRTYTQGTAITPWTLPQATGGDPPLTYSLTPSVPDLSFNSGSRTLSGTPTTAGVYAMTYKVTDSDGDEAERNFTITVTSPPPPERGTGLLRLATEKYRSAYILRADPVALPSRVDISRNLAAPGSQGRQNSCVGWAVAFALKTYHERVERNWPLTDDGHLMSPAYVYNQINGGEDLGSTFLDAFNLLLNQGVSSLALMPYNQNDYRTQPGAAARAEAANYKIANWGAVLNTTHAEFVREIKRHLVAGDPVIIGIPVYPDFYNLSESNPVYNDSSGLNYGGHAIVIVGYDNARSAFKIVNSWGTTWGIDGYGWIDYAASESLIWEAYVTRDVSDRAPPAAASNPSPPDASTDVPVDTVLRWTKDARTTSFDVYIGTARDLTSVDFQGSVAQPEFMTPLAKNSTYYWRIDARGAGGITQGPVWSFTTVMNGPPPPPKPVNPSPVDGATEVSLDTELSWESGGYTTSYDVYFGTSTPLRMSDFQRNQGGGRFSPDRLVAGTQYYWRIDAKNSTATTRGDEWRFVTTGPPPSLSISDTSVTEGNSGSTNMAFSVTLSAASSQSQQVTVRYATSDGSATAGQDYARTSGTLTFFPGDTSKTITVSVRGDTTYEDHETFTVTLSNATNATIADGTATGTIRNDDRRPSLSIADTSVREGNSGSTNMAFSVTLSAASSQQVTVRYATSDGSATAGQDYTRTSGTLTFFPGDTSKTINVSVRGDTTFEGDETFTVALSNSNNATIADGTATGTIHEGAPPPSPSIADASVTEGNSGTTNMRFSVTLSAASPQQVTVRYATSDGSAIAGQDYTRTSGTLTFFPGETSKTITVSVRGDTAFEGDETFTVTLSNPTHATIADGSATGTIRNDDPEPRISIADASVTEGNSGTTNMSFSVTLSAASSLQVTVRYATSDGSTTAGQDYTRTSGTLTFFPRETRKTINVSVRGDTTYEDHETMTLTLSNPSNAAISDGTATGTIRNDDPCNLPPTRPSNPSPANGATGVSLNPTLSWSNGDSQCGRNVTYRVWVRNSFTDVTSKSHALTNLTYNTTYDWDVWAYDNNVGTRGPASPQRWSFTTVPPPPTCDLTVSAFSVSDTTPSTGSEITLSGTVRNGGTGPCSSTRLRYYRSSDSTISTSDHEVSFDNVSSLNAGDSANESDRVTVPSTSGTYYYGACIDSVTGESNSNNNCSSGVRVRVASPPDLTVTDVSVADDDQTVAKSERFELDGAVRNIGSGRSGSSTTGYYQSNDSTISTSDTRVASETSRALDPGRTDGEREYVIAPSVAGRYYYGMCADINGEVSESNENNNCSSSVTVYVDDGGSRRTATLLPAKTGRSQSWTLTRNLEGQDIDYFKFVYDNGRGTLRAYTTGSTDTNGTLRYGDDSKADVDPEGDGEDNSLGNFNIHQHGVIGTYYIQVEGQRPNTEGPYTLHVSWTEWDQRDSLTGTYYWKSFRSTGDYWYFKRYLSGSTDADVFDIRTTTCGEITAETSRHQTTPANLTQPDTGGLIVRRGDSITNYLALDLNSGTGTHFKFTTQALPAGDYHVVVAADRSSSQHTGPYTLTVSFRKSSNC